MALINIRNLHKSFGNKTLFEDTSLTINPLERTGIVGVNGSGKTTLLKMMVGLEEVDSGSIESNKQARIEYLAQNPDMDETMTVLDYLFQGESPTMQLLRDYETMVLALAENPADERNQSRLTQINQRMDQDNGWAAEAHAKGVLSRLGLTDFGAKIGTLSGGQRRRAAMARVLIDPADLLILDEPTNHIDPDTIVWLEDLLANLKTGLLLVTHDRYFLDRVVNHIVEVDGGNLYKHAGNYSRFLENKAEREALTQKMSVDRRNLLKREIEWLNRSPMARGSKQKARIQRAEALQAQRINTHSNSVDINVATQRTGKQIMEIKGVSKSFAGQPVVKDFSYVVNHRARLGIIGPNGEGKSTLLNMIAGRLQPDAGEIEIGATVKIGYYDQESVQLDESKRIIDYISEIAEVVHTAKGDKVSAAQMLTRFMFSHAMQYEYISTLSGGERRRLYLL
ncbi:MAG: ABC-F family ATP-binding cassette domain-containing protein, partial [Chloroflexota bacterium]